ncbi:MAG: TonB-dependent receptor [Flavobacteriales bacterium]
MKHFFSSLWLMLISTAMWSQFTITGTVTDQASEPLSGATITLKDSYYSVLSKPNGTFSIDIKTGETATLEIDFIGYETLEQVVAKSNSANLMLALKQDAVSISEVQIAGVNIDAKTPMAYTQIGEEEIEKMNFGQDLPYILRMSPSLVTTSDAGAGIGYTGLRIRGSDATRINVTVNGIPLNDSESQGVFWVNMPDFGSSVNSIQIQRGVGTSVNGASAFGGTVNLQTTRPAKESMFKTTLGGGSYGTLRSNLEFSSGMINDKWNVNGRLSRITSDGYIDRASANLSSLYLNAGMYLKNTTLKAVIIQGEERTYQSWYGTPEAVLENDQAGLENLADNVLGLDAEDRERLLNADRTYNFYDYENQVDDYGQDHYQLHFTHSFSNALNLNISGHYTKGAGFFEEYEKEADLEEFGIAVANEDIPAGTITESDLIVRRWLDNDFYGGVWALNYRKNKVNAIFGGAVNQYVGDHFGEVIWSEYAGDSELGDRYYEGDATKDDLSSYLKATYDVTDELSVFGDVQGRFVNYQTQGLDNDLREIDVDTSYTFINPKFGLSYTKGKHQFYGSYSIANREPSRGDFIDATPGNVPEPETLNDLELGYHYRAKKMAFNVNLYNMDYTNQLVLTGEVNESGGSVRTNVSESFRRGIELIAGYQITPKINWQVNATFSQNKITAFTERVQSFQFDPDFNFLDSEELTADFKDTDISFSPNTILGSDLGFTVLKRSKSTLNLNLLTKYVGQQFLDNTSNDAKSIDAYLVNDIILRYACQPGFVKELGISFMVNNVLSEEYSSNGYTYSYNSEIIDNGTSTNILEEQNAFYPQAPINFLMQLDINF